MINTYKHHRFNTMPPTHSNVGLHLATHCDRFGRAFVGRCSRRRCRCRRRFSRLSLLLFDMLLLQLFCIEFELLLDLEDEASQSADGVFARADVFLEYLCLRNGAIIVRMIKQHTANMYTQTTHLQVNRLSAFVPIRQTLCNLCHHHFHIIVEQRLDPLARLRHLDLLQRMELLIVVRQRSRRPIAQQMLPRIAQPINQMLGARIRSRFARTAFVADRLLPFGGQRLVDDEFRVQLLRRLDNAGGAELQVGQLAHDVGHVVVIVGLRTGETDEENELLNTENLLRFYLH